MAQRLDREAEPSCEFFLCHVQLRTDRLHVDQSGNVDTVLDLIRRPLSLGRGLIQPAPENIGCLAAHDTLLLR